MIAISINAQYYANQPYKPFTRYTARYVYNPGSSHGIIEPRQLPKKEDILLISVASTNSILWPETHVHHT